MDHESYIRRCLSLACKGGGDVGLNPQVGALLVGGDEVLGEGWHSGWGCAHAERVLFEQINCSIDGSETLYVNLEPCCHEGKTPPCTDLIVEKGIKSVVYGMLDPNPEVAGQGIDRLQKAGVDVIGPVMPELCRRQNRGYLSYREQGRPWITIKSAQTTDGKYKSEEEGVLLKITTAEQDRWAHENLRATHDAILVGVETILADDPELTTRFDQKHENYRLILDPRLRVPLDATIVQDSLAERTIIVTTDASQDYADVLRKRGVTLWEVPLNDGLFDFDVLWRHCFAVTDDFYGITSILVEGGPTTWTTFRLAGMRDEEVILIGNA